MRLVLTAVVFLCVTMQPAFAERRIALVIGNGAYEFSRLENPPNDARAVARSLRAVGFDVAEHVDADQKSMKRAIQAFGQRLRDGGEDAVGLFFFAGHGVQARDQNYLIPVGAAIGAEADLEIEAVSAQAVLAQMEGAGNAINIVVLDACRNNPFKRSFRSAIQGLARMDAPRGSLIAYATAPGDVASDGAGANSPFTSALVDAIAAPGLKVEDVFKRVRIRVLESTGQRQTPWESSSLTGDFFFSSGTAAPPGNVSPPPTAATGGSDRDALFWTSIKDSRDAADFDAYLTQFPQGTFAALARNRLAALRSAAAPQPPSTPKPDVRAPVADPATSKYDGQILPLSSSRLLTAADIRGLDTVHLRLARNEIFARNGRHFQDPELQRYFGQFKWYQPSTWNPKLTAIEEANVSFLKRAEDSR